jgi:hypothetical protein
MIGSQEGGGRDVTNHTIHNTWNSNMDSFLEIVGHDLMSLPMKITLEERWTSVSKLNEYAIKVTKQLAEKLEWDFKVEDINVESITYDPTTDQKFIKMDFTKDDKDLFTKEV